MGTCTRRWVLAWEDAEAQAEAQAEALRRASELSEGERPGGGHSAPRGGSHDATRLRRGSPTGPGAVPAPGPTNGILPYSHRDASHDPARGTASRRPIRPTTCAFRAVRHFGRPGGVEPWRKAEWASRVERGAAKRVSPPGSPGRIAGLLLTETEKVPEEGDPRATCCSQGAERGITNRRAGARCGWKETK